MKLECLKDEYWYGGCVKDGTKMPISADSRMTIDTRINRTPNQAMPFFVSTKGRYLWKEGGFLATFDAGTIEVDDDCYVSEPFGTLKKGYLEAMSKHFPFENRTPNLDLFRNPIYNTWIELTFFQNQKDILAYADGILSHGMPAGVIMIDDGWAECYGDWSFHGGNFPDPKSMLAELHQKGFRVMVWVCPFISADSLKYREALSEGILIMDAQDEPYIVHWWNGFSAVLDMSNPKAIKWLQNQLDELSKLGVDGFKFDAGDSFFYEKENKTYANTTPNEQSMWWSRFGEQYSYNEYRVTFGAGGAPLLQRLCDKSHSWDANGVGGLIPDSLLQGITGHPYSCPDMIGGGEYVNFHEALKERFDEELFVRHCEIAALMPAMQFSAAPYRLLSKENFAKVLSCIKLRENYREYLMELIEHAAACGEPILRYLSYEFPEEPVERILDQFMLGDRLLVAPIVQKNETGREVYLPKGTWRRNGKLFESQGEACRFEQDQDALILFERME